MSKGTTTKTTTKIARQWGDTSDARALTLTLEGVGRGMTLVMLVLEGVGRGMGALSDSEVELGLKKRDAERWGWIALALDIRVWIESAIQNHMCACIWMRRCRCMYMCLRM